MSLLDIKPADPITVAVFDAMIAARRAATAEDFKNALRDVRRAIAPALAALEREGGAA